MIQFTPGVIQGCFDLMGLVQKESQPFGDYAYAFPKLGGVDAAKVIEVSQALGWLAASEVGSATLTHPGTRLLGIETYELQLRQALLDFIDSTRPAWLQNAATGRARTLNFISNDLRQVFAEAGLAEGTSQDIIDYWDELASRARGLKNIRLTGIGREGERMSISHELRRTGRLPAWVSIESNQDGYDILSTVSQTDLEQLTIEVKASQRGLEGDLHLTANEWERAQSFKQHAFHLWSMNSWPRQLAILSTADMHSHVPTNNGEGTWEYVSIPFRAFVDKFKPEEQSKP